MNSLSLLIYMAKVVDGLAIACGIGLFIMLMAILISFIHNSNEWDEDNRVDLKKWIKYVVLLFVILIFVPDGKVLYMIAASEVGETVINHPETIEIVDQLKDVLTKQLKELGE